MGWLHDPIEFSKEQRARLLSAWPKKASASAEAMLSYMAAALAEVLFELREDGELERPVSTRERAAQWRVVAVAAAALEAALKGVSDAAMDDAFEHDLGTDDAPAAADAYGAIRRDRSRWRAEAFTLAARAERWAEWSAGKPDHGVGDHRPRDAAAWEVGRRAVLAWAEWSGREVTVSFSVSKAGDSVGSPCMRFVQAVLGVANEVEQDAAEKDKQDAAREEEQGAAPREIREALQIVQGSGVARAICEEVRALGPAAADLKKLCGIPSRD